MVVWVIVGAACSEELVGGRICDDAGVGCEEPGNNGFLNPEPEPANNGFLDPEAGPGQEPEGGPEGQPEGGPEGEPEAEPSPPDPDSEPPVIDALRAEPASIGPADRLTLTASVSDPQGAHTIFGGVVFDDTAGGLQVAAFALSSPGTWVAQLGWPELDAAAPVIFGAGGSQARDLRAVFTDLSGNEVEDVAQVTLRCEDPLDAAREGGCAAPQGPQVVSFTLSRSEIRPGDRVDFRATARQDPDFPPGPLTARLRFSSLEDLGAMQEGPANTFTASMTWEQINQRAPLEYQSVSQGAVRSVSVVVEDARGQTGRGSATLTARCADPIHLNIGGQCVGECAQGEELCERRGPYGANCYPVGDRCWWLNDVGRPTRRTTCNDLCAAIDLRCDPEIGFPDGYNGVLERCYGSPGCLGGDRRYLCGTPANNGDPRLACICVR